MSDPNIYALLAEAIDTLEEIADQTIDWTSQDKARTTAERIKTKLNS